MSDAICVVSDHLQADIFWLSVCKSTNEKDYILSNKFTYSSFTFAYAFEFFMLLMKIVLMNISNLFQLANRKLINCL